MERIDLALFSIEEYHKENEKHKKLAALFESDKDFCDYVGEFWNLDMSVQYAKKQGRYSALYFVYIGDVLIGMTGLIWINGRPEIVVGILSEHRGNHYSKHLCQEYSDYVLESYQEYEAVYAYISPDNIYCEENALAAGFKALDVTNYVKRR